jgi:head-tail adaptor
MPLTDAEIDRMQAVGDAHLAGTAVIQRATAVSDSGGGGSISWANVGTVSARFAPVISTGTTNEDVEGGRMTADVDVIATVPAETDVRVTDRLVTDAQILAVTNVRAPQTWEVNRRIEATEVS